jgi:hypothetical protein
VDFDEGRQSGGRCGHFGSGKPFDGLDRGAAEGLDQEAMARHHEAGHVRRGLRDGAQVASVVHLEPDDVVERGGDVDGQEVRAEIDPRRLGDAPRPGQRLVVRLVADRHGLAEAEWGLPKEAAQLHLGLRRFRPAERRWRGLEGDGDGQARDERQQAREHG